MIRLFMRAQGRRFPIWAQRNPRKDDLIGPDETPTEPREGSGGDPTGGGGAGEPKTPGTARATPSLGQLLADRVQLTLTVRARFRIAHFQSFERVEDDLGDNEPRIFLVVGGNDKPGRVISARRAEAFLVGLRVVVPEFALLQIRVAEFPIFLGVVDTFEKALALLLLREVEKDFDDASPVDVEVLFEIVD